MKLAKSSAMGKEKSSSKSYNRKKTIQLSILAIPLIIYVFVFHYLPMPGIILAFQDYTYTGGLFGSKFVGFANFEYIIKSSDAFRIVRNTVVYNIIFIIVGNIGALLVALMMDRVVHRRQVKTLQTVMFLPYFISWVVVSYMAGMILGYEDGILNMVLEMFGKERISWYMTPNAWWFILPLANLWKGVRCSAIIYYGYIMGVDTTLYEAAYIDGCTEWKKMIYITIPMIKPALILNLILSLGGVMRGDFGLFFYLTKDTGTLYPTTDIIDTYVIRAIRKTGDISGPAAIGLLQSAVGFCLVMATNKLVKWIDPENRLF